MCGVVGFIDFNKQMNQADLERMTDALELRGPDSGGVSFNENKDYTIGLGHRRLSIIDLEERSNQPMYYEHLTMVYNGEVYNYIEIREVLIKEGYSFETDSDTEVVLKAFHKWGNDCVQHFQGMFAFAVFDGEKLYLFRDRVGVKPLYWYFKDGLFLFASELKSFYTLSQFKKEIDKESLGLYFQYGYIKAPHSIFKECYKLEPASYLEFDGVVKKMKYWELTKRETPSPLTLEYLEKEIKKSIELRLKSDVEVGIFLSGGVDSSLVSVLIEKRLKSFTLGFEESMYNETRYAKEVAKYANKEYNEIIIGRKDIVSTLEELPDIYDEPMADNSVIPTILLSKFASKSVKVVLSADGGDELFFGYDRYEHLMKIQKLNHLKYFTPFVPSSLFKGHLSDKINKLKVSIGREVEFQNDILNKVFWGDALHRLGLRESFDFNLGSLDDIDKILLKSDIDGYLSNYILTKVDRATMYSSIEGREPLLDHKLIELAYNMPLDMKYHNAKSKYPLKKILEKHLPKELIYRKKQGFGMPVYEWFKEGELKEFLLSYVDEKSIREHGLFNYNEVKNILDDYFQNKKINPLKVWFILVFQQWYKRWM